MTPGGNAEAKGAIMHKGRYFAIAAAFFLLLTACASTSESDPGIDRPRDLVGSWVFEKETDDGALVFLRAPGLTGNRSGFAFGEHGGMKVRTAGGGGAPATWLNLDGLWRCRDGRLLDIRHAARGGAKEYQLEIISLSERRLTCREWTGGGS
jgi:hypothetical protein